MIPLTMIAKRNVWSSCLVMMCIVAIILCVTYYLPIYFQAVKNVSPLMSGVYMLPSVLTQLLLAVSSGFLSKLLLIPKPVSIAEQDSSHEIGLLPSMGRCMRYSRIHWRRFALHIHPQYFHWQMGWIPDPARSRPWSWSSNGMASFSHQTHTDLLTLTRTTAYDCSAKHPPSDSSIYCDVDSRLLPNILRRHISHLRKFGFFVRTQGPSSHRCAQCQPTDYYPHGCHGHSKRGIKSRPSRCAGGLCKEYRPCVLHVCWTWSSLHRVRIRHWVEGHSQEKPHGQGLRPVPSLLRRVSTFFHID